MPIPHIPLVASTDVAFRLNVEPGGSQTVSSFELNSDTERPTQFSGSAVDDRSVRTETTAAEDTQPPIFQGGDSLPSLAPSERIVCLTVAGNQEELQTRSQAALTDAGWFVTATAKTTAYMLAGVVQEIGQYLPQSIGVAMANEVARYIDPHLDLFFLGDQLV